MRARRWQIAVLAALAVTLGALGAAQVLADNGGSVALAAPTDDGGVDWSPIAYPAQRLPLIFSHAKHLARGVPCAACHPAASTSRSAVDDLLPTEAACRACHAIDRAVPDKVATPVAACAGCHVGYAPGVPVAQTYLAPSPLKFDHAAHAKQACESCHPVANVDLATARQLPTMASCLTCHTDGQAERHCADCHLAKIGGLIETQFGNGTLVPGRDGLGDFHGPGFEKDHAQQAREVGATCTACHSQSECIECHQGTVKPMDFHPGNYLLVHATDARRGTPDCTACHREETFCVGCHEREGLGTRAASQFSDTDLSRRFHPVGWASKGPGPNLHAQEARRNIEACASCHREEDCLACHSAEPGGVNASPHPPSWRGGARSHTRHHDNHPNSERAPKNPPELSCDWTR